MFLDLLRTATVALLREEEEYYNKLINFFCDENNIISR